MTSKYEQLVIDAFARFKRRRRGCAMPVPQGSVLDSEGIDLVVRIFSYVFWIALQIKPSDTGETAGLVLPLRNHPPADLEKGLTESMRSELKKHCGKHPHANYILFVGRPNFKRRNARPKSREIVMDDVWKEIKKMFQTTALRVSKKTLKKQAF